MLLEEATWYEVAAYLKSRCGIILPMGSTEQHGPIGLIGTDALCAREIARRAGVDAGALVAPPLAYTPAPFNMGFAGTMSLSEPLFAQLLEELLEGLQSQGFSRIYILNGHGANLAPARQVAARFDNSVVRIRSWWDFAPVNDLRAQFYGDWEGMHATPAEVAITQAFVRRVVHPDAATPPEPLSKAFIKAHAGDKHGPPDEHRAAFPDGRVGSHSALATPEHGARLLDAAVAEVVSDYLEFVTE